MAEASSTQYPSENGATTEPAGQNRVGIHVALTAVGLLLLSVADAASRDSRSWATAAFWVGILVIFLPIAYRLLGRDAGRGERLALVILLGMGLYAVKILYSPSGFDLHDELGQYRSVVDILRSGRLLTLNPVVPAYSYYPALLSATAALSRLSGLGIFPSGLIVVGVARAMLMVGLFALVDRVTQSARVAGIAALLYAANPNFVFFDGEFAYESVAIGFAMMALWATARASDGESATIANTVLALIIVAVVVVAHHIVSYALTLTLVLWAIVQVVRRRSKPSRNLAIIALFAVAAVGAWATVAYPATKSDIGSSLSGSISGLLSIVTGGSGAKHPFSSAAGYSDPPLEVIAGLSSVLLLLLAWPWGLWASWRARALHPAIIVLALAALIYPATLALRLTAAGTETSNRSSEFVFLGIGVVTALAFARWVAARVDIPRRRSYAFRGLATACVGIVFVGGITVGWPPYELLPGPFEVGAESRSVDTENIAAARWAGARLAFGSRIVADTMTQMLMEAYGGLAPQGGDDGDVPVTNLFSSPTFEAEQRAIITGEKLRYLIVDHRASTGLPLSGRYFDPGPQPKFVRPIPLKALEKFDQVPGIDRVFDSGAIVIYGTRALLSEGQ